MAAQVAKIKITREMLYGAQRRQMTLQGYLSQLAEADSAGERHAEAIRHAAAKPTPAPAVEEQSDNGFSEFRFLRKRRLSPEKIQKILFLYLNEAVSVSAISGRMEVAEGTIYRILADFARREHNWGASNGERIESARCQLAQRGVTL